MSEPDKSITAQPSAAAPPAPTSVQAPPPAPASTAIQTTRPPTPAKKPPPARKPRKPMTLAQLAAWVRFFDGAIALCVLGIAFLCASFAVRNSDFWMHLAAGRLVAHGEFPFGSDPFSLTTAGVYWANHSWLYDLILYGFFQTIGGAGLVFAKALVITLLATLLLALRRPGQSLWIPACCVAVALVTMSPRLLFQPSLVSFLFLGLTLFLLLYPRLHRLPRATRCYWLLPPLFVLWVNMDAWFLLGPLTVGVYLAGCLLQNALAPDPSGQDDLPPHQVRTLGWVLLAGIGACLLSPFHYHAFTDLPVEISPWIPSETLQQDRRLRTIFVSPWQSEYLDFDEGIGQYPAGLTYFLLVALGVISFILSRWSRWRWDRLLLWLTFFVLSSYRVRTVPFFAVVAGPLTALNFQDFAAAQFGTALKAEGRWKIWTLSGRVLTLLTGLLVAAAIWPGWLQARGQDDVAARRVAWSVEPDPSYRKAAEQLHAWYADGRLQEGDHAFILSPDMANYCTWYCPEEKGFFDYRFQLFGDTAATYFDIQRGLGLRVERSDAAETSDAAARMVENLFDRKVSDEVLRQFDKYQINHVVLSASSSSRLAPALLRFWNEPRKWVWIYMDGRTVVFAHAPLPETGAATGETARLRALAPNPDRLCYGPNAERAPSKGLREPPHIRNVGERFATAPALPPLEREEAALWVRYSDIETERRRSRYVNQANGAMGATIALAPVTNALPVGVLVVFTRDLQNHCVNSYLSQREPAEFAPLLLAVRAARRAVRANPDDAESYVQLFDAYSRLQGKTRELEWVFWNSVSKLGQMRWVQMVAALQHALVLRPKEPLLQIELAELLLRIRFPDNTPRYLDAAVKLQEEALDSLRADSTPLETMPPLPGGPSGHKSKEERVKDRLDALTQNTEKLKKFLQAQEDRFLEQSRNLPVRVRVEKALAFGFPEHALAILDEEIQGKDLSDKKQVEEVMLQVDLRISILLNLGRVDRVIEDFNALEDAKTKLPRYHLFAFLLAMAVGDYETALDQADDLSGKPPSGKVTPEHGGFLEQFLYHGLAPEKHVPGADLVPLTAGWMFLQDPWPAGRSTLSMAYAAWRWVTALQYLDGESLYFYLRMDSEVLRGLIALEWGDNKRAARYFENALRVGTAPGEEPTARPVLDVPQRAVALFYLKKIRDAGQ